MTHDFHARDAQPSSPSDGDAAAAPSGYGADTTLIALAERLFELNQLRAEQFGDLLFASPAIDVMLALYIAYHDDRHADTQNIRAKCDLRSSRCISATWNRASFRPRFRHSARRESMPS